MSSLDALLDQLDLAAAKLGRRGVDPSIPDPGGGLSGWPALAREAATALLRIPVLDDPDAIDLYRPLITIARQAPPSAPSDGWLHPHRPVQARPGENDPTRLLGDLADTYSSISALLEGQPVARGRDRLHAHALRDRLLRPLNAAAEWTLHTHGDHLSLDYRATMSELAVHSRRPGLVTGSRYGDLYAVTADAEHPIDRALAVWQHRAADALSRGQLSTAGLRATLADLTIISATAYYLIKSSARTGHLDSSVAFAAGGALWDARNEWRAQARVFPTSLRLGGDVSAERNKAAGVLRDTLASAFQVPDTGDWQPAAELARRYQPQELLALARHLTGASRTIADHYAAALGNLNQHPVERRDPNYRPVFDVGTDLAKVARQQWNPVRATDPELKALARRGRFGAGLSAHAVEMVNETALGRPRTPSEHLAAEAGLRTLAAVLDASIPAPRHKHGAVRPDLRPAWRDGRTPPEATPDPSTPGVLAGERARLARAVAHQHQAIRPDPPAAGIRR